MSKIIELFSGFLSSKTSTIVFAFLFGIASYFYINTKITISNQKEEIAELNRLLGDSQQQVLTERKRCNNQVEVDILKKNNDVLKKENESLKQSQKELENLKEKKEEDLKNINNEINKLKNKECLNKIVDDETVESLKRIFNND
jgi:flagellar motility protein MotE (MotC chaperone)